MNVLLLAQGSQGMSGNALLLGYIGVGLTGFGMGVICCFLTFEKMYRTYEHLIEEHNERSSTDSRPGRRTRRRDLRHH